MNTYEGYNSEVSISLAIYFLDKEKAIRRARREEKREVRLAGEVA